MLELVDCLGQRVETVFSGMLPSGESNYFFRADGLPAGVYFVALYTERGVFAQKILVKNY
ncbi:MAG: T9SS type A sorting domain-containing protein [Saprospirales bacterium]|nr:T9SS type A sorting domain-containing protein [Saprospirales bacterium]